MAHYDICALFFVIVILRYFPQDPNKIASSPLTVDSFRFESDVESEVVDDAFGAAGIFDRGQPFFGLIAEAPISAQVNP